MITDKPNKGKCIYKTLKVECKQHPTCDGYAKKEKECPLAEIINENLDKKRSSLAVREKQFRHVFARAALVLAIRDGDKHSEYGNSVICLDSC